MARFSKGILKAKKHHAPNGVVDATPARLKHWRDQQSLMLSRNLAPSVHFDHSDRKEDNAPVSLDAEGKMKRGANNAVGRLAEFAINAAGNQAQITLDLPDDLAADKSRKNIVSVSPVIVPSFRDGDGNEYRDCIVAYDLVTHPVDNTQTPFVEVSDAIACSLRVFDDAGTATVYKLDENPFASEGGDKTPTKPTGADNPDKPPAKATDKSKLEAWIAAVAQIGPVLPSDFDFTNDGFLDILVATFNTFIAAQNKAEAEASADRDGDDSNQGAPTVANPGYAAMSLYAENLHRDNLKSQITLALKEGRCTGAQAEKYLGTIGTVKLSLAADGKQLSKSDVERFIDDCGMVPKGQLWSDEVRTKMSTLVEPPENMRGDFTTDEIQNTANWALGRKPATAGK